MSDKPKAPSDRELPKGSKKGPMDLAQTEYPSEQVEKLLTGEVTLRELGEITNEQLVEMSDVGYSMLQSGKSKEAKTIFTGLIAIEPREPYFRNMLGCSLMMEENWLRAEEVFSEALRLSPYDTNILVNRGEARLRLGRLQDAESDLVAAVKLDPESKKQSTHRARAIASYVVRTLEEAAQAAEAKEPSPKSSSKGQKK
jgi:Flp pilus assembly protein TadD